MNGEKGPAREHTWALAGPRGEDMGVLTVDIARAEARKHHVEAGRWNYGAEDEVRANMLSTGAFATGGARSSAQYCTLPSSGPFPRLG